MNFYRFCLCLLCQPLRIAAMAIDILHLRTLLCFTFSSHFLCRIDILWNLEDCLSPCYSAESYINSEWLSCSFWPALCCYVSKRKGWNFLLFLMPMLGRHFQNMKWYSWRINNCTLWYIYSLLYSEFSCRSVSHSVYWCSRWKLGRIVWSIVSPLLISWQSTTKREKLLIRWPALSGLLPVRLTMTYCLSGGQKDSFGDMISLEIELRWPGQGRSCSDLDFRRIIHMKIRFLMALFYHIRWLHSDRVKF